VGSPSRRVDNTKEREKKRGKRPPSPRCGANSPFGVFHAFRVEFIRHDAAAGIDRHAKRKRKEVRATACYALWNSPTISLPSSSGEQGQKKKKKKEGKRGRKRPSQCGFQPNGDDVAISQGIDRAGRRALTANRTCYLRRPRATGGYLRNDGRQGRKGSCTEPGGPTQRSRGNSSRRYLNFGNTARRSIISAAPGCCPRQKGGGGRRKPHGNEARGIEATKCGLKGAGASPTTSVISTPYFAVVYKPSKHAQPSQERKKEGERGTSSMGLGFSHGHLRRHYILAEC